MFSNDDLKKIASMPDELIKEKISVVVNSSSGGKNDINLSPADIAKIKQTVLNMTESDVQRIMSRVDPQKVNEIKNILSDDKK